MSILDSTVSSYCSDSSSDQTFPQKSKSKSLRIVTVNFQSIFNKKDELCHFLINNNIDIILGSETHLSSSISNSEFLPPQYTAYRCDRDDGYGGAIIITKKSLIAEVIIIKQDCEMVAIKVESFHKPVVLAACYRPPNRTITEMIFKEIVRIGSKYKQNPIWIGGDFNLPDIEWETKSIVRNQYPVKLNESFLETLDSSNTEQLVQFNTRKNHTLDLLITNRASFVEKCIPIPGFGDHDTAILTDIICQPKLNKPSPRIVFMWKRANIEDLKASIKNAMTSLIAKNSIESPINNLWLEFKNTVDDLLNRHVPNKLASSRFTQPDNT